MLMMDVQHDGGRKRGCDAEYDSVIRFPNGCRAGLLIPSTLEIGRYFPLGVPGRQSVVICA